MLPNHAFKPSRFRGIQDSVPRRTFTSYSHQFPSLLVPLTLSQVARPLRLTAFCCSFWRFRPGGYGDSLVEFLSPSEHCQLNWKHTTPERLSAGRPCFRESFCAGMSWSEVRTMNNSNPNQSLSQENAESSPDPRSTRPAAPHKSWSGTSGTSNGERSTDEAVGDLIAARLNSMVQDCIQQFTSSKEVLQPFIYEIKRTSDDITERLRQSRKQAMLRKDELEAERQEVQQAACKVIHVLNDTMDELYNR